MADTIIDGTQLNVNNIKYSTPKANASGGKSINILNKATNSGLRLTTPVMLTWGAADFVDPNTGKGNGKYEMALQFPSEEYKTEDASLFLQNMIALEEKIKEDAFTNSKTWFGKLMKSREVIDALYTPMLKYSKDKNTGEPDMNKAPVLRVKLPIWEGVWKCEIYDEEGQRLFPSNTNTLVTPIDYIQKGINVGSLLQCGGIWFANGKFGVTWKLIQAMVQAPKESLSGRCFYKIKDSDKAKITSSKPAIDSLVDEDHTMVEDSDEEQEYTQTSTTTTTTHHVSSEETQSVDVDVSVQPPQPPPSSEETVTVEMEEPKKSVVKKVVKKISAPASK